MDATTLRTLLDYNPLTGQFTWRVRAAHRIHVGDIAGVICKSTGYRVIGINGVRHSAHRLAWLHVHGEWPAQNIDHINGDRSDNRIENLRDVSQQTNTLNRKRVRSDADESVVYPGVRWVGHETGYRRKGGKPGTNSRPWLVKHHRGGKTYMRTVPDLLSAVALKLRLQAGGEMPPKSKKAAMLA